MYQLSAHISDGLADVDTVGAAKMLNYTVYNSEGNIVSAHPLITGGDVMGVSMDYQIDGDGANMMHSLHNATLDVFQVLVPDTSLAAHDSHTLYMGDNPQLELSSKSVYGIGDITGDSFHDTSVAAFVAGDVHEVPLVLNVDPGVSHDALQILGNGMLIDFSDLENISAKVKGVDSIEVRGSNNSISIGLNDMAQLNESHVLQITGASSNDIHVDLSGLGFTSTVTDGFITYTNGTYSIIVDQHLNQGGIIL